MKRLLFLCAAAAASAFPQAHEIGLTLGRLSALTRSSSGSEVSLDPGIALQANYGYRFLVRRRFGLAAEVHFLANGQREVRSTNTAATRDVATLYVTPGLRVNFAAVRRVSPFLAAGAGYALYEQSYYRIDGASNQAPRFIHRGAIMLGGGGDVPLWRWIGGRFEVRDFYSGNPAFNTPVGRGGQHNVVLSAGFVLTLGRGER